jgi:hypothetical protein
MSSEGQAPVPMRLKLEINSREYFTVFGVIYDTVGRCLRTLRSGGTDRLALHFAWDGRTDRGGTAAAGVYLVRADEQEDGHALSSRSP